MQIQGNINDHDNKIELIFLSEFSIHPRKKKKKKKAAFFFFVVINNRQHDTVAAKTGV